MPAFLHVHLLGSFEISWDGRSLPKPATLKSQSLLAYLIYHRETPQLRDHLCDLYWGDRSTSKARGSLSTALWQIHRCLPEGEYILSNGETIQFNPQADIRLDVDEFISRVSVEDIDSILAGAAGSGIMLARTDHACAKRRGNVFHMPRQHAEICTRPCCHAKDRRAGDNQGTLILSLSRLSKMQLDFTRAYTP